MQQYLVVAFVVIACTDVEQTDLAQAIGSGSGSSGSGSGSGSGQCYADTDCGTHEFCTTSRTCECVAGYTADAGACSWTGVVSTEWTRGENVSVGPGVARWNTTSLCALERVTQTVQMPRRSRAEPLVAVVSYRFDASITDWLSPAVGIGPVWHDDLPQTGFNGSVTARHCLGSGQYAQESTSGRGAGVPISLMPSRRPYRCESTNATMEIDRVEILPAGPGECPTVGATLNGNAEGTGGWDFEASLSSGSTAGIEPGVGLWGSRGVRMFRKDSCDFVGASTLVAVPSTGSPVLWMFNRTSTGAVMQRMLGSGSAGRIIGDDQAATLRTCLPPYARGGVFQFQTWFDNPGSCPDQPDDVESVYDNLAIIHAPACGSGPVADPGFESGLPLFDTIADTMVPFFPRGRSFARRITDPANAHSGTGVLELSASAGCEQPRYTAHVMTPVSSATGGPALRFFYKATPGNHFRLGVIATVTGEHAAIEQDNQYHQGIACLDPKLVGRSQAVHFGLANQGGPCEETFAAETAYIDDLAVTTDRSCPR